MLLPLVGTGQSGMDVGVGRTNSFQRHFGVPNGLQTTSGPIPYLQIESRWLGVAVESIERQHLSFSTEPTMLDVERAKQRWESVLAAACFALSLLANAKLVPQHSHFLFAAGAVEGGGVAMKDYRDACFPRCPLEKFLFPKYFF